MNFSSRLYIVVLQLLLIIVTLLGGCKEKDVPHVVDEQTIADYLLETEIGQNLFRVDNLIVSTPYTTVLDDAIYTDSVMSHSRDVFVELNWREADYGSLGWLREAVARVLDKFEVRTVRIDGADTTEFDHQRNLLRHGFLLKIGNDANAYNGWQLWGMAIDSTYTAPVYVTVDPSGVSEFFGDEREYADDLHMYIDSLHYRYYRYVRISELPTVPGGTNVALETEARNLGSPLRYYLHTSAASNEGFFTRPMTQIDREHYADTFQTPAGDERIYDVILLQSFNDASFGFSKIWAVPFKIPQ